MANSVPPKPKTQMDTHQVAIAHLRICVDAALIPRFFKLLERGFKVEIASSLSIRELLCHHLGISGDYVDNRIQTIFLDGKPVDNVETAWIENGSKLALSAAMPGLVGAVFRKGGFYASLRDTISYTKTENPVSKGAGEMILKLFNMVAKDLGPAFLAKGIQVEGKVLRNFVLRNLEDLKAACISIHLNNDEIDVAQLKESRWEDLEVFIQVTSEVDS